VSNVSILNKEKSYFNRKRLINKNKEEFKSELLDYARSNFKDQISDFSEASLGGMLLDFAAIVGESLTHYIDQQINELDYENASTEYSILNHLRKANITSGFASPSSAMVDFYILCPADNTDESKIDRNYLPIFKKETQVSSIDDINFILSEDVDFNLNPEIIKGVEVGTQKYFMIKKSGICISGNIINETYAFEEDTTSDFITCTLSNDNVTKIIKVVENTSDLNEYKEVEFLSQDTVYEKTMLENTEYIHIKPAAFRFVTERNFEDGLTSLRFGNSQNKINEDGVFTNPEELSLPLLSRDYTNQFSLDPNKLINSKSLGVSPAGKSINVKYQYGGGEEHNVQARSIDTVGKLIYTFPNLSAENAVSRVIIDSLSVLNEEAAVGGSNPLSLEELKEMIPTTMKMQSRIVTEKDLLARIYSMPSNFGRVSKVAVLDNPYSKSAKDFYIICKDEEGFYVNANDALKYNLSRYLNEYRLIGDTFNIIDASIYNIMIFLKIKISDNYDITDVLTEVQSKIFTLMRFEKLQIGEPINVNKIVKIALDTPGVLTIASHFKNIVRSINENTLIREDITEPNKFYNNNAFSVYDRYKDGIIIPPKGGIFELKYASDIEIVSG
jgi:hypothetical protein